MPIVWKYFELTVFVPATDRSFLSTGSLCLLKSPFPLRALMLRPTADTLLPARTLRISPSSSS
jgi:hypothetical protein